MPAPIPDVANSSQAFAQWWSSRDMVKTRDRAMLRSAIAAGLVFKNGDLLFLTPAGREHRWAGTPPAKRRKSR